MTLTIWENRDRQLVPHERRPFPPVPAPAFHVSHSC